MPDADAPFSILDKKAIAAAPLRRDPYAFVDQAMPLSLSAETGAAGGQVRLHWQISTSRHAPLTCWRNS